MNSSLMASIPPCRCSARWCAKRMSSTAIITSAGSRIFWPAAGWKASRKASRYARQRDRVFDGHLLEIVDQDFDTHGPSARDRNPQIVDPPPRLSRACRGPADGFDTGGRIGEHQRDLLDRERPERAIEDQYARPRRLPAVALDLDLGHRLLAVDMQRDRRNGRERARRR